MIEPITVSFDLTGDDYAEGHRRRRVRRRYWVPPGPCTVSFADDGVVIQTPDAETHADWAFYRSIDETEHAYVLRVDKAAFLPVPKRAFAPGDEQRWRRLVEHHVPVRRWHSP